MLMKIDERYRWDKYANYNCEETYISKYSDLETAKWACIRDTRCSAISVRECNPYLVEGFCVESKIGRGHVPGFCIYKKGDIYECICILFVLHPS